MHKLNLVTDIHLRETSRDLIIPLDTPIGLDENTAREGLVIVAFEIGKDHKLAKLALKHTWAQRVYLKNADKLVMLREVIIDASEKYGKVFIELIADKTRCSEHSGEYNGSEALRTPATTR